MSVKTVKNEKVSFEQYLKDTPKKKIHEDFLAHINNVLLRAKLKKDFYFDTISKQLAEKCTVYLPEKKLIYKMECKEKVWGYVKYKLEAQKEN